MTQPCILLTGMPTGKPCKISAWATRRLFISTSTIGWQPEKKYNNNTTLNNSVHIVRERRMELTSSVAQHESNSKVNLLPPKTKTHPMGYGTRPKVPYHPIPNHQHRQIPQDRKKPTLDPATDHWIIPHWAKKNLLRFCQSNLEGGIQEAYHQRGKHIVTRTGTLWTKRLIIHLWHSFLNWWHDRDNKLHKNTNHKSIPHEQLWAQMEELYNKHSTNTRECRFLFKQTTMSLRKYNKSYLQRWINLAKMIPKNNAIMKQRQQQHDTNIKRYIS